MDSYYRSVEKSNTTRRKFIFITTGMVAFGGVATATIPLLGNFKPAADVSGGRPITVDLRHIPEGAQIKILVNRAPVYIRHRAQWEIELAQADDTASLIHPETDRERLRPRPDGSFDPKFLVISGVCPHFGNIVVGEQDASDPVGRYRGWYCPSHGAQFDTSGRVRSAPVSRNLAIPDYSYVTQHIVEFPNHNFIRR